MMKRTTILLLPIIFLLGCSTIDKKELEVIEGIQLGITSQSYKKQLESLDIESIPFYTKSDFNSINEMEENQIKVPISDVINISEFRNSKTGLNHCAIVYPILLTGTDNVVGLNAVIGHTENPNGTPEYDKQQSFNQNVAIDYVHELKRMLESKYGQPTMDDVESKYNTFSVIEGKEVNEYYGDDFLKGKITYWETEYLEIELFQGLESPVIYKDYRYITLSKTTLLIMRHDPDINYPRNSCIRYPRISYKLKSSAIEKLKLNEKKI